MSIYGDVGKYGQPLPRLKVAYQLFISKLEAAAFPVGIDGSGLMEMAKEISGGDLNAAQFMISMMKSQGLIIQKPDGCWVKV